MNKLLLPFLFLSILSFGKLPIDDPKVEPKVPTLSTYQLFETKGAQNEKLKQFFTSETPNPTLLSGKRVALLTTDGVEEIELLGTLEFFKDRGAKIEVVAPRLPQLDPRFGVRYPKIRATHILTVAYMRNANWVKIDKFTDQVDANDFDALVIAGGAWDPDSLRIDPEVLKVVRDFYANGKITAAICHGPLVFINAGILKGRAATATWNVQLDLQNAGAKVQDAPVVVDGTLVTSRHPLDAPDFLGAIQDLLLTHSR